MVSQYFSRIYFSRYFYSSFKINLKTRIKITREAEHLYFYSDPYYFNKSFKKSFFAESAITNSAPFRSYFFPVYFQVGQLGNKHDLAWRFFMPDVKWFTKLLSLFIRFRLNSLHFNFIGLYFHIFLQKLKLLW